MFSVKTRRAIELRGRHPCADALVKLWGYIEASGSAKDAPEIAVLGGSIGEDSFTIRYSAFRSAVRVTGMLRSRGGPCEILLKFREERRSLASVAFMACGLVVAIRFSRSAVDAWIQWAVPVAVAGLGFLLPSRGTSPGFADAVADDIARLLDAERV